MMGAIEIDGLTKRYGSVDAVDGLDLTVERGEVFGFLGPNGAGKSTTINVLLDFVRPTDGHVSVLGYDPQTESRAVRDRIGILPEGYDLYGRLTARRNVAFAIELEDADDDPDALLERVGLGDDASRTVDGFSTGMRQRLALAMALVDDPDLLILDEPSAGLDPSGIQRMHEIVREEVDRGATVFFSSHLLDQVEAVCDRVGILNEGRLVAVDTVEGLREATDSESVLVLDLDEAATGLDLESVDGVTDVEVDGTTLRVSCAAADVKAPVINHVESRGLTVTDISTDETSLADLFTHYTDERAAEVAAE